MKRKLSARLICLMVAGLVLTSALAVSAINGSPYEVFKNSLFNAAFYDNYTLDAEFITRVNGEIIEREVSHESRGDISRLSISGNRVTYETDVLRLSTAWRSGCLSQQRPAYRVSMNRHGNQMYSYNFFGFDDSDRDSSYVRLTELAIDLIVGDLRNLMSMSSQGEGTRRVSGAISGGQLPEIAKVLIDIIVEESSSNTGWYTKSPDDNVWDVPIKSLTVNRIFGEADIDANDNLTYLRAGVDVSAVNIFDQAFDIELEIILNWTDIGISNPQSPIPGLDEIFTPKFMLEMFGEQFISVTFELDQNGNIDMNSIEKDNWWR